MILSRDQKEGRPRHGVLGVGIPKPRGTVTACAKALRLKPGTGSSDAHVLTVKWVKRK